ncbi:LamG-like jellyroll fold domain-containing protein [Fibrobacter sp. UWH3]|nr:LamG-like jellyroll fold domain-containing protein [Fibrobacter sp. UWH3]
MMALSIVAWAVPKPMESIENYNVLMVHGAYGWDKGFIYPFMSEDYWDNSYGYEDFKSEIRTRLNDVIDAMDTNLLSAYENTSFLGAANLGDYSKDSRITWWLSKNVFEEKPSEIKHPKDSYIYNWRSFSNPANSSFNNARELGDRTWNKGNVAFGKGGFGRRRALMEEAQEVKARFVMDENDPNSDLYGQIALDSMRNHPDLYHQLASRYILIGHSMGGVVSREYVQGDYYHDDVDKIITLDSPHEGTGALNMQVTKEARNGLGENAKNKFIQAAVFCGVFAGALTLVASEEVAVHVALWMSAGSLLASDITPFAVRTFAPEIYHMEDSLVAYVDPRNTGTNTIYSLNHKLYDVERQPMYRLLSGKNSLTFTDPAPSKNSLGENIYRAIVPDAISLPFENMFSQFTGRSDGVYSYVNAASAMLAGIVGISLKDNGSSIVPDTSSEAVHVDVLNNPNVDVQRADFNAAPNASKSDADLISMVSLSTDAVLALDLIAKFGGLGAASATLAKVAIVIASANSVAMKLVPAAVAGFTDLGESHTIPLYSDNLDTMKVSKNTFSPIGSSAGSSYTPYLMEEFLYEKPFVNLALNDSRTMDSLSKMSESARESSTLNRSCFYGADVVDTAQLCEAGLYGKIDSLVARSDAPKDSSGKFIYNGTNDKGDSIYNDTLQSYGSFKRQNYAVFQNSPLKFSSSSDWSSVGMKMDRWEKVDGLSPDGDLAPKSVPIRHVERYNVPAITVDNWIEKYSFVVDDLMPHRLRQIRMNFNYQEELAWECDVTKDPDAKDACEVFKRSGGGTWGHVKWVKDSVDDGKGGKVARYDSLKTVPHPVKKNGQFDFVPGDYGYNNLLAIQKDNQNTVTISTVNKIGLSNTQRFYYLFKATDNMLSPVWPQHNVVLNKIKGFKSYASALGYQGFKVVGAKDKMVLESGDSLANADTLRDMKMDYETVVDISRDSTGSLQDLSSAYFTSKWNVEHPTEGKYHWMFVADIRNMEDASAEDDSLNTYNVSFSVDTTAPVFNIKAEYGIVNPDSQSFVARFAWADSLNSPDIRAMRVSLEKAKGNSSNSGYSRVADFPAYYDVATPEFAIQWNDGVRASVRGNDGFYRIKALAVDNAVPDSSTYSKMNKLVAAIAANSGNVAESLWPTDSDYLNVTAVYDTFFVDSRNPELVNPRLEATTVSGNSYAQLQNERPPRDQSYSYATQDSLLKISYAVREVLGGRDRVPVTIAWQFVHVGDTTKIDHAGDSVWVESGDVADTSWTETSSMRFEDGDYEIRALVRDAAKNGTLYRFQKKLRVDKTEPNIESLVSTKLVYLDSSKNYSAKIVVNEKFDVASNRTGMRCHYRVNGSGRTTSWKKISDNVLKNDSVTFSLDSLDGMRGKCYLEAVCIDAAGNASTKTDLFFIGERTPIISSPRDSAVYTSLVAITGVAPSATPSDSLNTVYRLRYANVDSVKLGDPLHWETTNIFVVSALRNDSLGHVSKISQSNDGVLGYLDRKMNGKELEGSYVIELGTCAGNECVDGSDSLWKTDTTTVFFGESRDELFGDEPKWHFSLNPDTALHVGSDSLELSLYLSGKFNGSYFLRIYAEDSKHIGMFDESVSKVWRNPYYGMPNDTESDSSAVWFYELDGEYHLLWKGLAAGDTLKVSYDSAGFNKERDYEKSEIRPTAFDMGLFSSVMNSYLEDFPEWIPPSKVNHEMSLYGDSGHVVMTATEAFKVSSTRLFGDATLPKMRVYFGSSSDDGFYWIADGRVNSDTLNPLVMGWTVNPHSYGLKYAWPGTTETGRYPASGMMTIYVEATENTSSNPHVFLDSATIMIVPDTMKIALADTLPDFILLKNDSTTVCKSDTKGEEYCENRVLWLKTMVARYGIKNRDANVGIYVVNGLDTTELQNISTMVRANSNDTAYQISWNGKDSLGHAKLDVGEHKLLIIAHSTDGENSDTAQAVFNVKHAETMLDMTPDYPKNENITVPSIHVAEAMYDNQVNTYRYEPVADYLVKASLAGWKMPESLRDGEIPLTGKISGTQEIIGYEPKRFSLAIKRHRKKLDLVVVSRHTGKLDEITGRTQKICFPFLGCTDGPSSCEETGNKDYDIIKTNVLHFDSDHRDTIVPFVLNYGGTGWGFDGKNGPENGTIDIVVLTWTDYSELFKTPPLDSNHFKAAKNKSVWKLENFTPNNSKYKISGTKSDGFVSEYKSDLGCNVVTKDSILDTTCVYGRSGTTEGYDPNKNLFSLSILPNSDRMFYSGKDKINTRCGGSDWLRYTYLQLNIKFEIPDSYWDADFGMDNLVNRTVRFDHTNKTIFGNDGNGYWAALDSLRWVESDDFFVGMGSYHDGNEWKFDKTYGLLTPFETQRLHYFPSSYLEGGLNTFLFADEDSTYSQAARFDLRFYTPSSQEDFFEAKVLGAVDANEPTVDCNYDPATNVLAAIGSPGYCEIKYSGRSDSVKHTPYFAANTNVEFFVGRNTHWSSVRHRDTIAYPAAKSLGELVKDSTEAFGDSVCKENDQDWNFVNTGISLCYKYYDFGSHAHYYYGDYTDSTWSSLVTNGNSIIKNFENAASSVQNFSQNILYGLKVLPSNIGKKDVAFKVKPAPGDYDESTHRYGIKFDSVVKINSDLIGSGVVAKVESLKVNLNDIHVPDSILKGEMLYIEADSFVVDTFYRMSKDPLARSPIRPKSEKLTRNQIYRVDDDWVNNVVVTNVELLQLDSGKHSHLRIDGTFPDSTDMIVKFKDADSIVVKRPKELVEVRAYLDSGVNYRLVYLNGDAFYTYPKSMLDSAWRDSLKADSSGWYRLGWFNVNRLQGNTQLMLLWGDDNGTMFNFSKFDMIVGRAIKASDGGTVKSLYEEVSVSFPTNYVAENEGRNITVRTVDATDYSFEVFNNLALKGPIVEVLPSMTFENKSALPRVQMKISREEMNALHATPQTLRLYKVDFDKKKFVPLENALYGYLDKDGKPLVEGASDTVATCSTVTDTRCYTDKVQWAYLLISAETQTFSVFTAMDSAIAETPNFSVTVLPEIATSVNRTVRVDGISRFRLYVDDDSLWANHDDSTPPVALSFTADSNGFAQITLPSRGKDIDSSYVFVVALSEPDSVGVSRELPAAPAVARALTVNTRFACSVPSDSLWLGLDNGYMAYGASCTHPGYGLVSLYKDGRIAAEIRGEIPDTVVYDGSKTSGASRMGKIASDVYESRYVGVSALGMDMQLAGPRVYTDSARPVIENWNVLDTSEALNRIFRIRARVRDSESGVAKVVVTPLLGGDSLPVINAAPDIAGDVDVSVRISRKKLTQCVGCKFSFSFRAEDYGHNYVMREYYHDDLLYPFPTELALWYPAYEGWGKTVHEFTGSGHNLDLSKMKSPWKSDVGLYFGTMKDQATGIGHVNFETTKSYSFEARLKVGYTDLHMRRVFGFEGYNGLNIELRNRGKMLCLAENSLVKCARNALLDAKNWNHVVVSVDSSDIRFYVNGELAHVEDISSSEIAGVERELYGSFSMGQGDSLSYIGNVADVRMYGKALSADEVYALSVPVSREDDVGEEPHIIVVAVGDMNPGFGAERQFSCSVAGNKYLDASSTATVEVPVSVEYAGVYKLMMYVRSASQNTAQVSVGEGSALLGGSINVEPVWRAAYVSGVSLNLAAGVHTLRLNLPAGLQVGGFALTSTEVNPSSIAWGVSTGSPVPSASSDYAVKVKSYLRYEGYPETSTLRPRIRLKNVSSEPVNGFYVRYYFRGEDASQAKADRYWPNENVSTFPAVYSESANTGYVEWKFTETIPVGGTVFGGDGPHFGLYNADYIPWDASDDPSFIDPNSGLNVNVEGFYEDAGIIVLDSDNNLIGGSCAEMEDPVSPETKVRVLAADVRGDNQASEIHIKVENVGNVALKNFDVRYYFFVEEGQAPDYEIYDMSECSTASIESLGSGRWQLTVHCDKLLAMGKSWQNPVKVALHLPSWAAKWNVNNDPSHDSLGMAMREFHNICVFDSTGYMLYGNSPAWVLPASDEGSPDSVYNVDFGYQAPDNSIPVVRTQDGLVVILDSWVYVEFSLVTAMGTPVKSIFNGTLAPGEQLVRVDWTGIDMGKTYLMLKVNGAIKSTKKLSLL